MASPVKDRKPVSLPAPNSDFYELVETLPAEELAIVKQVRAFMLLELLTTRSKAEEAPHAGADAAAD